MTTVYLAVLAASLGQADGPPRPDHDLPPGAVLRLGSDTLRHRALSAAFTPDGKFLVTGGADVRVWDARTWKLVRTISIGDPKRHIFARHLQVTADGKTVYTWAAPRAAVQGFDLATGKPLARFGPPEVSGYSAFAVSPNGRTLALATTAPVNPPNGGVRGEMSLWEITEGVKLHTLPGHQRRPRLPERFATYLVIESMVFSRDGKWLASLSGAQDDAVRLFDVATGKERHALRRHPHLLGPLAVTPEGHLAVVSSPAPDPRGQAVITFWNMESGKVIRETVGAPGYRFLTFSPDGKWAAGLGDHMEIHVWDAVTGKIRFTGGTGPGGAELAFSQDGNTFVACRGTHVELIDLKAGRNALPDRGHLGAVKAVDVSPDGATVASAGEEGEIRLWDAKTGASRVLTTVNGTGAMSVAFSPDGRTLATSAYLSDVVLWDVATGKALRRFPDGDTMWGSRVAFSPDGKTLAVTSSGITTRFIDLKTGQEGQNFCWCQGGGLPDGDMPLRRVPFRFSPDGKHFASLYAPRQREYAVGLLDLSKQIPRVIGPEVDRITDLAFSPDGEYLAWSDKADVHLWDVRANRMMKTLRGAASAGALVFTPDGKYLLSGRNLHPLSDKSPALELPIRPGHLAFSRNGGVFVAVAEGECALFIFDGRKLGQRPGK